MLVFTTVIGTVALFTPFTETVRVPAPTGVLEGSSPTILVEDTDEIRTSMILPPTATCAETPASAAANGLSVTRTGSAGPRFLPSISNKEPSAMLPFGITDDARLKWLTTPVLTT